MGNDQNLLTRPEELVLLAVLRLKEHAYSVPIKKQLEEITGKRWVFGAVYVPLERLEKKGLLVSNFGDPTPERGGKRKRVYSLTSAGAEELLRIRSVERAMWENISEEALEKLV